jgi:hypothetical protein
MSALGQERTFSGLASMSALPPKADMDQSGCDVRFVPKADMGLSAQPRSVELKVLRRDFVDEMKVRRPVIESKS